MVKVEVGEEDTFRIQLDFAAYPEDIQDLILVIHSFDEECAEELRRAFEEAYDKENGNHG